MYDLYYFSRWEGDFKSFIRLWVNNTGFELSSFLATIGKNSLACRKKIDWFPTAADKLINNNYNIIFFENSMISVPSIASWEFTNQISTKSV